MVVMIYTLYQYYPMNIQRAIDRNLSVGNIKGTIDHKLECKMLQEELDEFKQASIEYNTVEMVDWLIDIMFVAIGTLHKLWLSPQQIEDCRKEVCDSNYSKLPFTKGEDGKVSKWPHFKKPNLEYIISR